MPAFLSELFLAATVGLTSVHGARPVPGRSVWRGTRAAEIANDLRPEFVVRARGDAGDLFDGVGRNRSRAWPSLAGEFGARESEGTNWRRADPVVRLMEKSSRREDFAAARIAGRGPKNCRHRFVLRPGGTPQEISRGQARSAGAAPGCAAERSMPQRGIEEVFGVACTAAFPRPAVASGHFLRCPVGARSDAARYPGAASAGADLPPANLLRRPSGTGPGVSVRTTRAVRRSSEYSAAPSPPYLL